MIPFIIFTGGVALLAFLRWRQPSRDNRLIKRRHNE